jgi:macrolide-specific efflux system membrane fusion protein
LRAEGFLDAAEVSGDLVGKGVRFLPAEKSGEAVAGVLRFVSPEIDPVTNQVRVWAEIDNRAQTLRSGQQGTLEIAR